MATLLTLLSQFDFWLMKKKIYQVQQILADNVRMDTQTFFHTNGDVNIFPCGWVDEQVTSGVAVRMALLYLLTRKGV